MENALLVVIVHQINVAFSTECSMFKVWDNIFLHFVVFSNAQSLLAFCCDIINTM